MKKFKAITVACLIAIGILVAGNVMYLYSLYQSLKAEQLLSVTECMRRADMLEIISRFRSLGDKQGNDESFIRLTLLLEGEKSGNGYSYSNQARNIEETMTTYFHFIEEAQGLPPRNYAKFDSLFIDELNQAGIHPKVAFIVSRDSVVNHQGLWHSDFIPKNGNGQSLTAYFSSLNGLILAQMSGILATSAGILLLMSLLIWYLLHSIGKLRTIEEMKDDFTHNMTHELKTPVAVAYSAADSMLRYYDGSDEKRNRKLLGIIMQRLNYLSGLIENILSMSMERFKHLNLSKENIELRQVLSETAEMIKMKAQKPITTAIDVSPENLAINTDPLHFGNIITNLLDNAVKYSGASVDIKIKATPTEIKIADNGIGISSQNIPYIFEKFYRVPTGNRHEVSGYGLGLFYVAQMVKLFGWSISAESELGKGTTFTIKMQEK